MLMRNLLLCTNLEGKGFCNFVDFIHLRMKNSVVDLCGTLPLPSNFFLDILPYIEVGPTENFDSRKVLVYL